MSKLLSANFARLWKNKVFWTGLIVMFLWALLMLTGAYRDSLAEPEYPYGLDSYFFQYALIIGGFCAVFTSLFLGVEYSDGAIRNKIVVGHSRYAIYLSNLIVNTIAGILMNAVWVLVMLSVGTMMFGTLEMNAATVVAYLCISAFMIAAFASIYVVICMLNQNIATAAVMSILLFFALLFLASYFHNRLSEPEMYESGYVTKDIDGAVVQVRDPNTPSDLTPNKLYVRGNLRTVFQYLVYLLPTGQGLMMSMLKIESAFLWKMPLFSLLVVAVTTVIGLLVFQRKDLK